MKKIAILGCGQLGSIVADAIASGLLPDYTLCAAMSRKLPDAEALCAKAGGAACVTLDEVLTQEPDYGVETAAVQVAKESCLPVLEAGLEAEEPPEGALVVPEEPLEQPASRPTHIAPVRAMARNFFIFDTPFFSWIQVIHRTEMSVQQKHLCAEIREFSGLEPIILAGRTTVNGENTQGGERMGWLQMVMGRKKGRKRKNFSKKALHFAEKLQICRHGTGRGEKEYKVCYIWNGNFFEIYGVSQSCAK